MLPLFWKLGLLNLIVSRAEFCTCQQNTKCCFSQILTQVLTVDLDCSSTLTVSITLQCIIYIEDTVTVCSILQMHAVLTVSFIIVADTYTMSI